MRSSADPEAEILVDPSFAYLAHVTSVVMNGQATAEQCWFVKSDAARIQRIVVVHFERWNDGAAGAFNYPRIRMRQIGDEEYLHRSFPFEEHCEIVGPVLRTGGVFAR